MAITREQVFSAVGEVAILFSNIDYFLGRILSHLIDKGRPAIGGAFVAHEFSLHKKVEWIRRLAPLRLCHNQDLQTQLISLCDQVADLSETRNQFVHSMWVLNDELMAQDKVACMNVGWRRSKDEQYHWQLMRQTHWHIDQLKALPQSAGKLIRQAAQLSEALEEQKMMPPDVSEPP